MLSYYGNKWHLTREKDDYPEEFKTTKSAVQNKLNKKIAADNKVKNAEAKAKNEIYDKVLAVVNSTKGGDYLDNLNVLKSYQDVAKEAKLTDEQIKEIYDSYNSFYKTEKIGTGWSIELGAKPPAGDFDADFYLAKYPDVAKQWKEAVANNDLDIVERYKTPEAFALSHYTFSGKPGGLRGNKEQDLEFVNQYVEPTPTDAEIAKFKDALFTEAGELGVAATEAVTADAERRSRQLGALTKDILKETIGEMKRVQAQQSMLGTLGNMQGFGEVLSLNKNLFNSFIGDTGVGGLLGFTPGGKKMEENLQKSLQGITGINTTAGYNWQQWFDTAIKNKYAQEEFEGVPESERNKEADEEAAQAREFIEKQIVPRFNQSKTISEFVDSLELLGQNENVFNLQDAVSAATKIGEVQAQGYLDALKEEKSAGFDSDFYFNPLTGITDEETKSLPGVEQQIERYEKQKQVVGEDWELAKQQLEEQSGYWLEQAYKYGVDLNDKEQFAKLHFQVKGRFEEYDGAPDLWNPAKAKDYIYEVIAPIIQEQIKRPSLVQGSITPREMADQLLSKLDTQSYAGSYEDLQNYVTDLFKAPSATSIDERLEQLRKEGIKPSQESLGAFYIERGDEVATQPEAQTALFKIFQDAGYGGNESSFYTEFFPDLDIQEQKMLSMPGQKSSAASFLNLDMSSPLGSIKSMEELMGQKDFSDMLSVSISDKKEDTELQDFFKLGLEEDEPIDYKSKSGSAFLKGFTSSFVGF